MASKKSGKRSHKEIEEIEKKKDRLLTSKKQQDEEEDIPEVQDVDLSESDDTDDEEVKRYFLIQGSYSLND